MINIVKIKNVYLKQIQIKIFGNLKIIRIELLN